MVEYRFTVGEQEKHEIYIRWSEWSGKLIVDLDGKRIVDTYFWSFKKELELDVGKNEKHRVKIILKGIFIPKAEVYVDNKLVYST
ncbi:MAG: hypothetical protein DRO40_05805 [Thermoprotei archaeon]|nr:MAG: hypothetical protein DRO40_05805 [Thermoprotei archaeon]